LNRMRLGVGLHVRTDERGRLLIIDCICTAPTGINTRRFYWTMPSMINLAQLNSEIGTHDCDVDFDMPFKLNHEPPPQRTTFTPRWATLSLWWPPTKFGGERMTTTRRSDKAWRMVISSRWWKDSGPIWW
jgi:hypothetical protein